MSNDPWQVLMFKGFIDRVAAIQHEPHVAFTTNELNTALVGQEVLMPKYTPFKGYTCVMIRLNEQPVELIQTTLSESESEIWGDGIFKDSMLYPQGKSGTRSTGN